MEIW
jgi:hypothetical protein